MVRPMYCLRCMEQYDRGMDFHKKWQGKNEGHISSTPKHIDEIELVNEERFTSGIGELDRVFRRRNCKRFFGAGRGDPGIGKSTLMLQICQTVQSDGCILYASGEESQNHNQN